MENEKYVIWINVPKDESDMDIPKRYIKRIDYRKPFSYKGVPKQEAEIFDIDRANRLCYDLNLERLRKNVEDELRFAENIVEIF